MQFFKKLFSRSIPVSGPQYSVPPDHVVYAVGDIHGRFDLLEKLVGMIAADRTAKAHLEKCSLVFLGDYVDRGFQSKQVLDYLRTLKPDWCEVICLRGNHEDMMLAFLDGPLDNEGWLHFGGMATLASYDTRPKEDDVGRLDLLKTASLFDNKFPREHRDFIRTMPLSHRVGDYMFVHAGLRPGVALDSQHPGDLTLIRQEFTGSKYDFGVRVVHGHTGVQNPVVLPGRIAVDTIAYATGRLTAAVLHGESVDFMIT